MDQRENIMGTMPVRQLLLRMSWPTMLSMFVQALYNTVDSIFVAKLSDSAFIALSLVFPVQTLMVAILSGLGVGINAMLSRHLGEKRPEAANAVANTGVFLYALCWIVFAAVGLFLSRPFLCLYSDDPVVINYGVQYMTIVLVCSLGCCAQFAGERMLQATGDAIGPMIIQGSGAIINLILDPIFIFGLFGVPRLEVAGAAIATVLGEFGGMWIAVAMVRRNRYIRIRLRSIRPVWSEIREIFRIGVPAIAISSLFTLMTLGMNKILDLFSDTGVFIMGAFFKIQSFIYLPVFGLNNGLTPAVSFNYGARSKERIMGLIHFALAIAAGVMILGMLIFLCFPAQLLSLFSADTATMADGIPALRILSLSFLTSGLSIVLSAAFQALGSPSLSLCLSLMRQIFVLLPLALGMGLLLGAQAVWAACAVSEGVCFIAALFFYRRLVRTKITPLEAPAAD